MPDATELVAAIKRAAKEATEAEKPATVIFGTVTQEKPLTIITEQQLPLGEKQLVLCRSVTDYEGTIEIDWDTEEKSGGEEYAAFSAHTHQIVGEKTVLFKNALQAGEKVAMIQQRGGQKYLVIDRVVSTE